MKKALLLLGILLSGFSFGQFNTSWLNNLNSTTSSGYIGLGTQPTSAATTPFPSYNLHLHGTSNYTWTEPGLTENVLPPVPYGKTTRLGLTNTTTGMTENDGALFQMSELDFYIKNQEVGDMILRSGNSLLNFRGATGRLDIGYNPGTSILNAKFNIVSSDNGLYIRTTSATKYGMSLNTRSTADAIQVFSTDVNPTLKNFKVTGSGEVFARKYTTTLANIPDYVFADDYDLMTFAQLRAFVQHEKHLPNVPSAKEYEANGVDLGEMNRVLLEKVEELTLYILQLEERVQKVEAEK
jgi:hypothetical protein